MHCGGQGHNFRSCPSYPTNGATRGPVSGGKGRGKGSRGAKGSGRGPKGSVTFGVHSLEEDPDSVWEGDEAELHPEIAEYLQAIDSEETDSPEWDECGPDEGQEDFS